MRTDNVRGDAGQGEQRGNLLLVDVFPVFLPAVRVDVDQQLFGSAGCNNNQSINNFINPARGNWLGVVSVMYTGRNRQEDSTQRLDVDHSNLHDK